MKRNIRTFWEDETAMGTIEMVALIVVLVGLAILFKEGIKITFDNIMDKINGKVKEFDTKTI